MIYPEYPIPVFRSLYLSFFVSLPFDKKDNIEEELKMLLCKQVVLENEYFKMSFDLSQEEPEIKVSIKRTSGCLSSTICLCEHIQNVGKKIQEYLSEINMKEYHEEVENLKSKIKDDNWDFKMIACML